MALLSISWCCTWNGLLQFVSWFDHRVFVTRKQSHRLIFLGFFFFPSLIGKMQKKTVEDGTRIPMWDCRYSRHDECPLRTISSNSVLAGSRSHWIRRSLSFLTGCRCSRGHNGMTNSVFIKKADLHNLNFRLMEKRWKVAQTTVCCCR